MSEARGARPPRLTAAEWMRLEPLVDAMLDLPADERLAYVGGVLTRDTELGSALKRLLDDSDRGDSLFDTAADERFALLLDDAPDRDDVRGRLQGSLGTAYTIEHELGGAGMSRVFVAHESELGRRVVVKVLAPDLSTGISVERFAREISVSASLQQANIVPVLAAGRVGAFSYYIMPLVDGRSLRERLKREGALPIRDALSVLRDVARGLAYAHDHGVVHRDIKPGNILLSGGAAVVIDFGIAKALDAARERHGGTLTQTSTGLGTPMYAAPEQVSPEQNTDHRADIYALGVVAYELLTGHPPFVGRSPQQLITAHITESPAPVDRHRPSISPPLAALVMRCLAKNPADRPQTATELYSALDAIAPTIGDTTSSAEMQRIGAPRHFLKPLVAITAIGLLVIAGWFAMHQRPRVDVLNSRRIVVTPFRNLTGDSTLDVIGSLIAVGVANGLEQLDSISVVPSHTGVTDPSGRPRFLTSIDPIAIGTETRAGRAVGGSYSRQGDTLRLQAQIIDVNTGAVERTLDPVVGELSALNGAIERLRDNVATAFEASAARNSMGSIGHLPTLPAYREFAYAFGVRVEGPRALPHLIKATQLDTTFTLALYWLAAAFVSQGRWKAADSIVQILAARSDRLTPVERDLFESIDGYAHSNFARDLAASRNLFARDSTLLDANGVAAGAMAVNRPREVLTVLGSISPRLGDPGAWVRWRRITSAHHMLGHFREAVAVAAQARARQPSDPALLDDQERALAAEGDIAMLRKEIDRSVATWSNGPRDAFRARNDIPNNPGEAYEHVVVELFAHNHPADAMTFVNRGIEWHAAQPPADEATDAAQHSLAHLLMLARRLDSAQAIWARLAIHDTLFTDARVQLAITAAWRGDTVRAERTMRTLDSLAKIQYAFGRPLVHEARIAAALGRKAEAVGLLERAMQEGAPFDFRWHADAEFQSLRDFVPFQTLIAPKG